jgi:hypothetical protein
MIWVPAFAGMSGVWGYMMAPYDLLLELTHNSAHPGEGRDPGEAMMTGRLSSALYDLGPGLRRDERGYDWRAIVWAL